MLLALIAPARADGVPELRQERMIGPGARCTTLIRPAGPWVIHVFAAEGGSGFVRPGPTFASERGLRAATVSDQARRATTDARYPIAGVNGDFFAVTPGPFEAAPVGALVIGGEVIHSPYPRSALLLFADGHQELRRLRLAAWVERPDGTRADVTGVNQPCGARDLILYTPRFGPSTPTKGPATELALTGLPLPVRLGTTYRARVAAATAQGAASIPADGVVLSGRGAAGEFLGGVKVGDELQFRLDFDPPVPPDTDVVGGGPALVRGGRVVVTEDTEGFKPDVVAGRAPRTAVGFNGRQFLLVTVDGRQPGISVGMTLVELAQLMRELGCTEAMNLDGGGSTTAWARGAVINRPTDGHERSVAEGLFLFSTAPHGPPVRLTLGPEEIAILAGAACPLTVSAEDEYYNPVPAPAGPVAWEIGPELGMVDGDGRLMAAGPRPAAERLGQTFPEPPAAAPGLNLPEGDPALPPQPPDIRQGTVRVQIGELTGSAPVRIYAYPPRLAVTPAAVAVAPGGSQALAVRPLDEWGQPLLADGIPVHWSCPPALGQVDESGHFHAAETPGQGELTVEIAGMHAVVPVVIGTQTRSVAGFDKADRWSAAVTPPAVIGSLAIVPPPPGTGEPVLRLAYDFRAGRGTRAVYARTHLPLGRPLALRLRVRGEGGGAWLRARLRDARGHAQLLDFARHLGPTDGWQELTAAVPAGLPGPLTLEALYLVETDPQAAPQGVIELAGLAGDYPPAAMAGGVKLPTGGGR